MDESNWRKYELLFKGELKPEQVEIILSKESMLVNEFNLKAIEYAWNDFVKFRKSIGFSAWNNTIYSLINLKVEQTTKITLGETTYKQLQGTNATNSILGDIYGEKYLSNGLLVESIVKTSDNKYVLGKRNAGHKNEFEQFSIFGGTIDKSENEIQTSKDFFNAPKLELKQELGIDDSDIEDLKLIAIFKDYKKYPIFLFLVDLKQDSDQLNELFVDKGSKDEHIGVEFFNEKDLLSKIDNASAGFSDIALSSFDIYYRKN